MATTTTNFGWDIPQSTDLVKDGATAIAGLGQDIDTSMADLKGGTSGQILSKASNTDMDFTWVSPNPGDITGVTAGTGLTGGGTSGDVTVSFDVANYGGGQYAAGKNKIINGDFNINQRNFTSISANGFGFDRWYVGSVGGTVTYTPQTFTPGTAPVSGYEGATFARCVSAAQSAAGDYMLLRQTIEDVRTLAGQTATISFWAKASSGTPKIAIEWRQDFGSGGSPSSAVNTYAGQVTLSTSWTRYSVSVSVPSLTGKTIGTTANTSAVYMQLFMSAGSDFNSRTNSLGIQNNTFDIWGVQVEAGSTATAFQTATGTKQGELAACQRYYIRYSVDSANLYGNFSSSAWCNTATKAYANFSLPVPLRITIQAIDYSNIAFVDSQDTIMALSSVVATGAASSNGSVMINGTISGGTANRPGRICANNSTSGYIGFSSEL